MTFIKNTLIIACIALLALSSCKNDLKLNAPYKEIPIVYAVLNPYESRQMIRINKVFLGEGDANQMAQVADSVNYPAGELSVSMVRTVNGTKTTFYFTDSLIKTDKGTDQRVYICSESLATVRTPTTKPLEYDVKGDFVLTIKNNKTGNVFTAKASTIERVSPKQNYSPISAPYFPYDPGVTSGFIDYSAANPSVVKGSIRFLPVDRGKIYDVIIRHHVKSDFGGGNFGYDYPEYTFNDPKGRMMGIGQQSYINITFKSGDYFYALGNAMALKKMDEVNVLRREIMFMEYIIHASTQEYLDFVEFSKPSLSLNQNKPLYSNFDNRAALGIFTFRSTVSVSKQLDPPFITAIASNSNTCRFKFVNSSGIVTGCK